MKRGPKPIPVEVRFWNHVKKTKTCWIWTANQYRCGYGQIGIGSRSKKNRRKIAAHRLAYEIHFGKIPDNLFVCHKCNQKNCVNPHHLYLADCLTNTRDAINDGLFNRSENYKKNRRGSKNPAAKLTEKEVKEIRKKYKEGNYTQLKLATEYKIHPSKISSIIQYKTWKHI